MPEATPEVSTEVLTYRPLSVLAMLALGLGVFAPLSLLSINLGLFVALPLPGLIISIIACRRIAAAEGALAGGRLAQVGLGLNLMSVVAWLTMYLMTSWVIQRESQEFADKWIAKLHDGRVGEAFLDTMVPKTRKI